MNTIEGCSGSYTGRKTLLHSAIRRLTLPNALLGAMAITTPLLAGSVQAQEQAVRDTSLVLETVTVTARRREENLQDIPLSVTAFTAEGMERRGITDLEGVAAYTAGLNFDDFVTAFNGLVTLRGLVQANIQNRVTNVAFFIDGLHVPRNYSLDLGVDFERVEVVKGPQSALYGQNAFAGAINYVTVKPSLTEVEGSISGSIGMDDLQNVKGSISVPLIENMLAARAFFGQSEFDGNRTNNYPGVSGDDAQLGGYDRDTWSLGVLFEPTEDLSFDLYYQDTERQEEIRPYFSASGNTTSAALNCGPIVPATGSPNFWCGEMPTSAAPFQTDTSTRPDGLLSVPNPGAQIQSEIFRATIEYAINDDFSLRYIGGKVDSEATEQTAPNDNPTAGFQTFQREGGINKFTSHELRLAWDPDGPLSGEVGYFTSEIEDAFNFGLGFWLGGSAELEDNSDGPLDISGLAIPFNYLEQTDNTDAVFFALRYDFMDGRANFSFEGRYAEEDKKSVDVLSGSRLQEGNFDAFTPRVSAEYQISDNNMVYVSVAKGVKAGGFNGFTASTTPLTPDEQAFDPEENWTYEIGSKNVLFDGRLVLNASAYFIDWSDMQVTAVPSGFDPNAITPGAVAPTIFLNVGNAENWGIELDGIGYLTPELSVSYAFSYSNPEFSDGTKWGQFVGLCDGVFCPADGDVSGNTLPRQSEVQSAVGMQYETDISGMGFFARADYTYQSKQYLETMNFGWISARDNVNASIGISGERWSVTAWGRNLMDETYVTNSLYIGSLRRYTPALNDGLNAGITATLNF
ncbi:MAG: iron complex outermembrane receptor protein [Halieaceae bacterium]|jgi:iron complex outermembrane receptor protein